MNELERVKLTKMFVEADVDVLKSEREHIVNTMNELESSLKIIDAKIDHNIVRLDDINKFLNELREIGKEYDCFEIISMKLQGKSNVAIAKELGIHKNTVANKLKFVEEIMKNA